MGNDDLMAALDDARVPDFAAPQGDPIPVMENEIDLEERGMLAPLPLPFAPRLTNLSKCTMPGTLTLLVGTQGSTKSFLTLNIALAAHAERKPWRILPLEGTHRQMMFRAAAVADCSWDATLTVDDGPDAIKRKRAALRRHMELIRDIAPSVCAPPRLDAGAADWERVAAWAEEAMKQARIVIVDSLHFVGFREQGRELYRAQEKFAYALQSSAQRTGATAILVCHTQRRAPGDRRNPLIADDTQGAMGMVRAADCVVILTAHEPKEANVFRTGGIRETVEATRTIYMAKTRHGKGDSGTGRIAFTNDGPAFRELGIICPER